MTTERSGPANLNSAISGNSGRDAGLKAWRKGVFDDQEESIGAAYSPAPQFDVQGAGGLGGRAGTAYCITSVSLKAFGDLAITASAARRLSQESQERFAILVGTHLIELARLLNPGCRLELLKHTDVSVPAIFDLHLRGVVAGLMSVFELKNALKSRSTLGRSCLLFDRISWRERLIIGNNTAEALPPDAPNIYLAYEKFLMAYFELVDIKVAKPYTGRNVGIFPGSRIHTKNIPNTLIEKLASQCLSSGFNPVVFSLDGEWSYNSSFINTICIPKTFASLIDALHSTDLVISADSLPAHLAEYYGLPVYVVSPSRNEYWLPRSAFEMGFWGLFEEMDMTRRSLGKFLANV